MPLVIAHRGASADEVENSLAAFRRAVTLGSDGIELDVHGTADGTLVVLHDDVLAGQPLARLSLDQVRTHRLPNGEPIPTLADALAVMGPGVIGFVEVKALPAALDQRLLDCLDQGPAVGHYRVHSFDHRIIRRLRDRRPTLGFGALSASYPCRPLAQLADAGATDLWQQDSLIDRQLVAAAHDEGYRVIAWTVDDPLRMAELVEYGVDGVCTNRPDLARRVLA